LKIIKRGVDGDKKLQAQVEQLSSNIKTLEAYTSYFDRAISDNVVRDLRPQEITDVVNSFVDVVTPDLQRSNVVIDSDIAETDLYTTSMHPSEWASILFNLYTNSRKAIKRANRSGKIYVKAGQDNGKIYLEFSDNGDGIPEKNEAKIFDAFFTTSTPVGHFASEQEEILGTGLGLKIVKDVVTSYGGDIKLVNPAKDFSTCFRIEIPQANDEEMELI
jgi:signal transduction histidine kinase